MKKIIRYILGGIFYGVTIFTIVCLVITTIQRFKGEQPRLFGYTVYVIQTDSMTGEIEVGEAILSKKGAAYEVGSVVTYIATSGALEGQPITHKVVGISKDSEGTTWVQTQGVKVGAPLDTPIKESQIEGVMVRKLKVSKKVTSFMKKPYAMYSLLLIPVALYGIYEVYMLVTRVKEKE